MIIESTTLASPSSLVSMFDDTAPLSGESDEMDIESSEESWDEADEMSDLDAPLTLEGIAGASFVLPEDDPVNIEFARLFTLYSYVMIRSASGDVANAELYAAQYCSSARALHSFIVQYPKFQDALPLETLQEIERNSTVPPVLLRT